MRLLCRVCGEEFDSRYLTALCSELCKDVAAKYSGHKYNSRKVNVGFEFILQEWWGIWRDSGKWEERGNVPGKYVMARFGDQGVYKVGNVRICLWEENRAECEYNRRMNPDGYRRTKIERSEFYRQRRIKWMSRKDQETMVNVAMVNETMVNETMVRETRVNETMDRETMVWFLQSIPWCTMDRGRRGFG